MIYDLWLMVNMVFLFWFSAQNSKAIYDPLTVPNNKFGIHVFSDNEVDKAAELVNTSGGEWGYITVPIESKDRNREKWNEFMHKCKEYKLIPIVRLATFVQGENWQRPSRWDSVDFANFLNDLDWPTKNRYVVVYNEPNHANEWGGSVDPIDYGRVLTETMEVFKERNEDFYMLPAGLDVAAPNSETEHMNWKNFLYQMNRSYPEALRQIHGWNSHSYPNPAFSSSPYQDHDHSIVSYRHELDYVKKVTGRDLVVFITETGWSNEWLSEKTLANYWRVAIEERWTDDNIVAITPFVMFAGAGPFESFSFLNRDMQPKSFATYYINYVKTKAEPMMAEEKEKKVLGESSEVSEVNDPNSSHLNETSLGTGKEEIKFDIKKIEKLWEFIRGK